MGLCLALAPSGPSISTLRVRSDDRIVGVADLGATICLGPGGKPLPPSPAAGDRDETATTSAPGALLPAFWIPWPGRAVAVGPLNLWFLRVFWAGRSADGGRLPGEACGDACKS